MPIISPTAISPHNRREKNWSSYWTQQLNTVVGADNIVANYPLNDLSGTICTETVTARNGTYNNVTLDQVGYRNGKCVLTSATSYINIYNAGLYGAMSFSEGSVILWFKMPNAQWKDGAAHMLINMYGNDNNYLRIRKAGDGGFNAIFRAGGTTAQGYQYHLNNSGWNCVILTWSATTGKVNGYFNGKVMWISNANIGTWNGSAFTTNLVAIASQFGTQASESFVGNISNVTICKKALSATEVDSLCLLNAVIFDGDSRVYGSNVLSCSSPAIGNNTVGIINVSVAGGTPGSLQANAATRVDPYYTPRNKILVFWAGYNSSALTTEQIYAQIQTYCAARKAAGWQVILCTEIDAQSATAITNEWPTKYLALNTMLRAGYAAFADRLADLGANAALQDATSTTYYNADKVHLIQAGYDIVGGIIEPHITALL